jgi:hypothetical protein
VLGPSICAEGVQRGRGLIANRFMGGAAVGAGEALDSDPWATAAYHRLQQF